MGDGQTSLRLQPQEKILNFQFKEPSRTFCKIIIAKHIANNAAFALKKYGAMQTLPRKVTER